MIPFIGNLTLTTSFSSFTTPTLSRCALYR